MCIGYRAGVNRGWDRSWYLFFFGGRNDSKKSGINGNNYRGRNAGNRSITEVNKYRDE